MDDNLVVEDDGNLRTIRINRPDKKNALTQAMYKAMADSLVEADSNPAIRVIILTGSGDAFTSGNDLHEFLARKSIDDSPGTIAFMAAMTAIEKPVIAAVNGLAVGIGGTLLLHCDLVYAADHVSITFPFVNLGAIPEFGSTLLVPRMTGHPRAFELLVLGEAITAREAQEMGLVNKVVAAKSLMEKVREVAQKLAAKPPAAVRASKALLKDQSGDVTTRLPLERKIFTDCLQSPESKEAINAILEKRKPDFSRFS